MKQYLIYIVILISRLLICCLSRQTVFESFFDKYNSALSQSPIRDTNRFLLEYDFIIVGAGSGGSVVANRLSEERNWNILLLESGKEESLITDIPISSAVSGITGRIFNHCSHSVLYDCSTKFYLFWN